MLKALGFVLCSQPAGGGDPFLSRFSFLRRRVLLRSRLIASPSHGRPRRLGVPLGTGGRGRPLPIPAGSTIPLNESSLHTLLFFVLFLKELRVLVLTLQASLWAVTRRRTW